ncbi:MAG: hypothetical protein LH606_16220 [Cytophagaceae bacterium]|nr:hypothetical protein [Cytophagaceae bacterium]
MKKAICLPALFLCLVLKTFAQTTPPQAEISNGIVRAKLYLPDEKTGYYRGTRFDWAGVIASLDFKNHSYFGPWFERYDPKLHDAISGPVEEFTGLGYETAKAGETFIKIGVGVLRKPNEPKYHFSTPYELVDAGTWTVKPGPDRVNPDRVDFTQQLTDATGYAYTYRKTLRLTPGKPELVLEHSLKNTGNRVIETSVYNHNFLVMDRQPSGPDFVVKFPFDLRTTDSLNGKVKVQGKELIYERALKARESSYSNLQGFGSSAQDYDIRVENRKTGAGVRIRGDRPIDKLAFWTNPTNLSPEPFIKLRIEPGQETTWNLTYEFYSLR